MNRIISSKPQEEDRILDSTLRPRTLQEFVGQEKIKKNLEIFLQAAKKRNEATEHILLYGNSGLGKTSLAYIIAKELGTNIRVSSGPVLERAGDMAAILTSLENKDILFLDEFHRLNNMVEEILYPAMEEYAIDMIIGRGPGARTLRLDLPRFTLIGATTRMSLISSPLRNRFGFFARLDFYSDEEIEKIVERSSKILNVVLEEWAKKEIARRARKTPRVANRLLKRVRDYAQVKNKKIITQDLVKEALGLLEIDELGLDEIDRRMIKTIIEKFQGGPVGLNAIAASINEEMETIEDIYEPFLMQINFLQRTPKGRVVTEEAYRYFGYKIGRQKLLK